MKKLILSFLSICISALSCLLLFTPLIVHGQTFTVRTPNFSLCSDTPEVITSGEVHYDTSHFSPSDCTATEHSKYYISASAGQTLNFSIPFLSSAIDLPSFDVAVNGKAIKGSVYYGDTLFDFSDDFNYIEAIESTRSSELDTSASGTLYIIKPQDNSFTVHLKRLNEQALIYESAGRQTSTSNADGLTMTMETTRSELAFYVTNGDFIEFNIVGAEYDKEPLSQKEFIDRYFLYFQDLYDETGAPPIEFFYSLMNIVSEKYTYSFDDFFFSSYTKRRCNTYTFSFIAESDNIVISYDTTATIQANSRFSPVVYLVEQIHTASYPIKYSFALNAEYPYLLESSAEAKKTENDYSITVTEGSFYYIFCSEKKPTDLYATNAPNNTPSTLIIVLCVVAGVAVVILISLLIYFIIHKERHT